MSESRIEVLSYGEALVDFLPDTAGAKLRDVESFRKTIGGAPANAAVGLARLGRGVALLGKVGEDEFGYFLLDALRREGVDVRGVEQTGEAKTGITFISLDEAGDRSFLFFREPSADMTMRVEDVDHDAIDRAVVTLFGSNLLTEESVRAATREALESAKSREKFIVVDANVRPHLWSDLETAHAEVTRLLAYADIVKMNEEELEFVGRGESAETYFETQLRPNGVTALVVTRAARGAAAHLEDREIVVAAPELDTVADTTGAGDGFVAGFLAGLCRAAEAREREYGPHELRRIVSALDEEGWEAMLSLGCYVGTEVCRSLGATPALPAAEDIPWDRFPLS